MSGNHLTVAFVALAMAAAVFAQGPIPQDPRYHAFADTRTILGIPNGCNVLSNALFLLVGAGGFLFVFGLLRRGARNPLLPEYLLFFAGIFLTGAGSAYYHYDPSNASLLWDRLPMAIAFMALLSSVVSECIDRRAGAVLLAPLLGLGIFSVCYWGWSESVGRGDLRLYVLAQFLPMLLIPLMLILYRPPRKYAVSVWLLASLYAASKLFELFDRQAYALLGLVSGHTLKHALAAAGAAFMLKMLHDRRSELTGQIEHGTIQ